MQIPFFVSANLNLILLLSLNLTLNLRHTYKWQTGQIQIEPSTHRFYTHTHTNTHCRIKCLVDIDYRDRCHINVLCFIYFFLFVCTVAFIAFQFCLHYISVFISPEKWIFFRHVNINSFIVRALNLSFFFVFFRYIFLFFAFLTACADHWIVWQIFDQINPEWNLYKKNLVRSLFFFFIVGIMDSTKRLSFVNSEFNNIQQWWTL